MPTKIFKNCIFFNPVNAKQEATDVLVCDDHITHVAQNISGSADSIVDAQQCWLVPKFFDLCQRPHIRHPEGFSLEHETQAARSWGFGHICIPPDASLIADNPFAAKKMVEGGMETGPKLYPIGALTHQLEGTQLTDMSALMETGCIAISQAQSNIKDLSVLRQAYQYAASFDIPIIIQPSDPWFGGYAHDGVVATRLGLKGNPDISEAISIATNLQLIEDTQIKAHFSCLSSKKGVQLIAQAKEKGLNVTCDTAMHSLFFTEEDILGFNSTLFVFPPLRTQTDKLALREGLQNNIIDAICSDHRPLHALQKQAPFADSIPGLSTIDTFLSCGLTLIDEDVLTPWQWIHATSIHPARCLKRNHSIQFDYGFCLIDPADTVEINDINMRSQGKNYAFKGQTLKGKVIAVT